MATIKSLARKMRKLNLKPLKIEAVRKQTKLFEDIQKQQLRQGLNSKAETLTPSYPKGYAGFKGTLSTYHAPLGVPDLYLKGGFARGIMMKITGMRYDFFSTDSKSDKLTKKYGKPIWGIAPFNMPRVQAASMLELRQLIAKKLS